MMNVIIDYLNKLESVVVAYSGGVDSTLLLRLAKEAGIRYEGVIIDTPLIPRDEVDFALKEADRQGLKYSRLQVEESFLDSIRDNPENRCYICKRALFSALLEYATLNDFKYVLDGSNDDDKSDYRPGAVAIKELGIISPFAELGINKQMIRDMAKSFELENWATPARACLASRIVYGDEITVDKLNKIEKAESILNSTFSDLGLENIQFRIRLHGDVARIEVPDRVFDAFLKKEIRLNVIDSLKKCGFRFIALDLEGYRMGSLNEVLN